MIVVHATVRARPEDRQDLIVLLRELQQATRDNDRGCLRYSYSVDIADDCLFTCVELWSDMESLRAHLDAPHMNDPHSRFDELTIGDEQVEIFVATPASGDLFGGQPD